MDDRCRIRAAGFADLGDVARIEREAFGDPWSRDAFATHLADLFLVAECDGETVGFLVARRVREEAEILDLAVTAAARERGIGTGLVEAALDALSHAGAGTVYLEVRPSNARARAVYGRLGFLEVGRRGRYYRDPPEDALVLARPVRPGDA